ncbi:MAG: 50S ribosomal protein L25 [Chloroflexota bacterium]
MADRPSLAAERRTVVGKGVARLRRTGRLPAVVFGHGTESEPISLDAHAFEKLRRTVGASTLVNLAVDGGKVRPVLIAGVQLDKITDAPIHVDLFAVQMAEELTVEMRLIPDGIAPAATRGGSLVHPVSVVKARALPGDLPDAIHYDLSSLATYEDTITVADLVVPAGMTILADPADVIARVLVSREVAAAAADGTAPAEGAEAAS